MAKNTNRQGFITTDDFKLWKLFDHTRFIISRSREVELAQYGLTPEQAHVLDILSQTGGKTTINEIVAITQRQHHSISTLINRMAKQGFMDKLKDSHDSRKYVVISTKKGQKLFKKVTTKSITTVFSGLSDDDKKNLSALLSQIQVEAYQLLGKEYKPYFLSKHI